MTAFGVSSIPSPLPIWNMWQDKEYENIQEVLRRKPISKLQHFSICPLHFTCVVNCKKNLKTKNHTMRQPKLSFM